MNQNKLVTYLDIDAKMLCYINIITLCYIIILSYTNVIMS